MLTCSRLSTAAPLKTFDFVQSSVFLEAMEALNINPLHRPHLADVLPVTAALFTPLQF